MTRRSWLAVTSLSYYHTACDRHRNTSKLVYEQTRHSRLITCTCITMLHYARTCTWICSSPKPLVHAFASQDSLEWDHTIRLVSEDSAWRCAWFRLGRLQVPRLAVPWTKVHSAQSHTAVYCTWKMNTNKHARVKTTEQACLCFGVVRNNGWPDRSHLAPCPCTLTQALVDWGRFQSDVHCNLDSTAADKCKYYQGAVHCVLSTFAT